MSPLPSGLRVLSSLGRGLAEQAVARNSDAESIAPRVHQAAPSHLLAILRGRLGAPPRALHIQAARALLGAGTLFTLLANGSGALFSVGVVTVPPGPRCDGVASLGVFCSLPGYSRGLSYWVAIAVLILSIAGVLPRVVAPLHWWVSASLFTGSWAYDGGDQITAIIALLLIPAAWCLDWRFGWLKGHASRAWSTVRPGNLVVNSVVVLATVQMAILYFQAAVAKFGTVHWPEGTALWYWFQGSTFSPSGAPHYWILALLAHPAASIGATWGTMALEFSLAILILSTRRWARRTVFLGCVALHGAIALLMGLVSFGLAMVGAVLLTQAGGLLAERTGSVPSDSERRSDFDRRDVVT